jgi:deazaflavin-dependent oxidoreductase (nitroreductase family)
MQIRLTTTGARTGARRAATLYAWEDGDALVIVGSRGGAARNPAWVHNLRAHPRASVEAGKRSWQVEAREVANGAERERLWAPMARIWPDYDKYQTKTDREIPVVVLDRVG